MVKRLQIAKFVNLGKDQTVQTEKLLDLNDIRSDTKYWLPTESKVVSGHPLSGNVLRAAIGC